jgi:hypothetical protein
LDGGLATWSDYQLQQCLLHFPLLLHIIIALKRQLLDLLCAVASQPRATTEGKKRMGKPGGGGTTNKLAAFC